MSYKRGDLQREDHERLSDERDDNYDGLPPPVAYLDHSCDEWIIGGRENLSALLDDIKRMLDSWPLPSATARKRRQRAKAPRTEVKEGQR